MNQAFGTTEPLSYAQEITKSPDLNVKSIPKKYSFRHSLAYIRVLLPARWETTIGEPVDREVVAACGRIAVHPACLPGLKQAPIPDLAEQGRQRLVQLYTAWGKPDEARRYGVGG